VYYLSVFFSVKCTVLLLSLKDLRIETRIGRLSKQLILKYLQHYGDSYRSRVANTSSVSFNRLPALTRCLVGIPLRSPCDVVYSLRKNLCAQFNKYGYEIEKYGYEIEKYGYEIEKYGYEIEKYGYEIEKYSYEIEKYGYEIEIYHELPEISH